MYIDTFNILQKVDVAISKTAITLTEEESNTAHRVLFFVIEWFEYREFELIEIKVEKFFNAIVLLSLNINHSNIKMVAIAHRNSKITIKDNLLDSSGFILAQALNKKVIN